MRKIFILLFILSFSIHAATIEYDSQSAFQAAATSLTIIDFEEQSAGTVLTGSEYSHLGLTIQQRDSLPINVVNRFAATITNSGVRAISSSWSSTGSFTNSYTDNLDFIFLQPVYQAGLWIGDINGIDIQFLDVNDQIIASKTIPNGTPYVAFYGIITDQQIKRIRAIEPANDGDGISYDDIMFSSTVPEPASLLCFFTAILLLYRCLAKNSIATKSR